AHPHRIPRPPSALPGRGSRRRRSETRPAGAETSRPHPLPAGAVGAAPPARRRSHPDVPPKTGCGNGGRRTSAAGCRCIPPWRPRCRSFPCWRCRRTPSASEAPADSASSPAAPGCRQSA
ncbi:PrgI family protein, partial [Dysosmobacter welbionis]